jgi:cation-transporting ATPase E
VVNSVEKNNEQKPKVRQTKKAETKVSTAKEMIPGETSEKSEMKSPRKAENDQKSILETLKNKKIINVEEETVPEQIEPVEKDKKGRKKETVVEEIQYQRYYDTNILQGLTSEIVEQRKADNLVNITNGEKGKTVLGIILANFFTFFNMLYFAITIVFIILRAFDNLMFLTTIIPNLIIGIIQEIKAKKTMDKLSLMSAPTTTVIRDGEKMEIPVQEVVLDDIVFFTTGKQICADSIVLEGFIEVNEALLTGESDAVLKNPGDQLLSGSFVVSGMAVARVDKIGKDNYIEKLSKDAKMYQKPKSELLRTLNGIIKVVSVIIIPLAILTYITSSSTVVKDFLGIMNRESIIKAASTMLAMIPAGLFLLTSMALAVSVIRLAKSKTLVQELYCIEMLARVNVLCLDKTGTITDGTMRVTDCIEIKNPTDYTIREIVGSMMQTFEDSNPTSEALIKYFDINNVLTATDKIPFSSKRKYSAVTFGDLGTFILGAPEFVLTDGYDKVAAKIDRYTNQGCRVLVLAQTSIKPKPDESPRNAKPICLIVLQDHIREDATDTIDYFKQNGVDIKVISGDNPATVSEIALRAGVEGAERYISLAGMTDDEVRDSVFEYTVFGRVSPNQKRILVKTLKEHKKTVAMTGDGVNDILALKEADCSIAMASGSEAARYVSHLVLMDSNFSSMPKVVKEGRRVINNIQKTSTLYLVKTMFSIMLTIMYIILGVQAGPIRMSYPFSAKNLYLIEWFAIGVPSVFLALQPNTDIVKGKFLPNIIRSTLPGALTVVLLHLLLNFIRITKGFESLYDNNVAFTTILTVVTTAVMIMVLFQVSHPFNWLRKTIFILMIFSCLLVGFNVVPIAQLDLSYRRSINDYKYDLVVGPGDYWWLNGEETGVKAVKKPNIVNHNEADYVAPVISINENFRWCLNGIITDLTDRDTEERFELQVVNDYWTLNGRKTAAKAYHQPGLKFDAEGYRIPELTIDKFSNWCLDGYSTGIRVTGFETELNLTVVDGYWHINNSNTNLPAKELVIENEYAIPEVTIKTVDKQRFFALNGEITTVPAGEVDEIKLMVSEDGYWQINDVKTGIKAEKNGDVDIDGEGYVKPIMDINGFGRFTINNISTDIEAENNLLITEILITFLLVQLIYPLMYVLALPMKRFKTAS